MSLTNGTSGTSSNGLVLYLDPRDNINYILSEVEVLVVAGGGGGGTHHGGGGGAGGLIYSNSKSITSGSAITVTVGNGGAGGSGGGAAGSNSVFGDLIAIGGGGGGGYPNSGGSGGSGGGPTNWSVSASGGSGKVGQGFGGNRVNNGQNNFGGGGGGAGQQGGQGKYKNNGGDGLPFNISGTLKYYAGGGGSGIYPGYGFDTSPFPSGGLGGGGAGGNGPHGSGTVPIAGGTNTGGGGGGVADLNQNGAAGGSGIVIVRYPGPQKATGGNTIATIDGYTIHTFTSSGTFTPLAVPVNAGAIYGLQDLSGNNNTILSVNSPTFQQTTNNSILLNGTNQYFNFGNSLGNDFNQITVSAWVRPTTFPGGNYTSEYLVTCDDGSSGAPDSCFALTIQHHNSPTDIPASFTGNLIAFGIRSKLNPYYFRPISIAQNAIWEQYLQGMAFAKDPAEYALNTWMHLVGTYDGSVTLIYINGVLKGSSNSQPDGVNRSVSGPLNNTLLTRNIGSAQGANGYFGGNLGIISIYNKSLTITEILQNYNATKGRFGF